jgi:hypothetical protein
MTIAQDLDLKASESSWSALQSGQHRVRLVCLVASAVPLLMFVTVVILRGGFPIPVGALLTMVGISLLVVNAGPFRSRTYWLLCGPIVSLLMLLIVTAIGLSPIGSSALIAAVIAIAGGAAGAWNLVAVVARTGVLRTSVLLSLGLFLGLYAESMY